MYICLCNAITERDIRDCVEGGASCVRDLECRLGVGTCCGRCMPAAKRLLSESRAVTRSRPAAGIPGAPA